MLLTIQAIYERMFTWIVRKINSKVEVHDSSHRYDNNVIGVLDIYGFEIFDNNRWVGLNLQPHHTLLAAYTAVDITTDNKCMHTLVDNTELLRCLLSIAKQIYSK